MGRSALTGNAQHNTPHQCAMRKTHVAETHEAEEERERNEGGCASGRLRSDLCYVKKIMVMVKATGKYTFSWLFTEGF